jgi:superfamily II DNA/RNA helicase
MNGKLKRWIAQSESWQAFIDLHIPQEAQSAYHFLPRYDDFYISLMNYCIDILSDSNPEISTDKYLLIAKGLEIFSLKGKCDNFKYIDKPNNMLFAAGLYYLADHTASALILALLYSDYNTDIDIFISNILKRNLGGKIVYIKKLREFFETGDFQLLAELSDLIEDMNVKSFNEDIDVYVSSLLAKKLIKKISKDNIWNDLLKANNNIEYWKPYVLHCINKKHPIINFFPSQRLALDKGVLSEKTISLQMPTSAGKTFLSEVIIYNQIKTDPPSKILYLTPYRSLASELKKTLAKQLKSLGISTSIIYGGNLPSIDDRNEISTSSVLISTPEKFIALQNIFPFFGDEYSTIICDEGHLLDDSSRGLEYELLLSRLRANKTKKRFVFISAIIPNLKIINEWLGGTNDSMIESDYRPAQLDFAFLRKVNNTEFNLEFNPGLETSFILNKFLTTREINLKKDRSNYRIRSKKGITVASALKAAAQGPVLIFAPHKRGDTGVEGIVNEIIKQLGFTNIDLLCEDILHDKISDLVEYFTFVFGANYLLVEAIKAGVLYHHGDFPQFIRETIEDSINEFGFKLIVCTNTLTEGVNLPIRTIVVHSTERFNPEAIRNHESLSTREIKNLIGRAGRAGKEIKGLIIVPHDSDFNIISNTMNGINSEQIYGNLYNNIIRPVTKLLIDRNIKLNDELLAEFERVFPNVIESIDISLLELLSEEVGSDELMQIVLNLVSNTFSYFQSDDNEKDTLARIFTYRANILLPYINSGDFKTIKSSGASISLYKMINEIFDFENEIWCSILDALADNWLVFILDEGIFKIDRFKESIDSFNSKNHASVNFQILKAIINNWMKGNWYDELAKISGISLNLVLELMNKIFLYEFQGILSSIIRIAEIKNKDKQISPIILNWAKMFQYGFDSQLKIDLLELGLTDRVAILFLNDYCNSLGYNHQTKEVLKKYINTLNPSIRSISPFPIPNISFKNLIDFMDKMQKENDTQRTF